MNNSPSAPSEESVSSTDEVIKGILQQNPVFVQVLGMCPVLAVTNSAWNALAMGLATASVLVLSNVVVSTVRSLVPKQVRIVTFILMIATFVTIIDYLIQALSLELHRALGAFISLIVVNCLILGRAEAFASKHSVSRSFWDALGMATGFTASLLCLGSVRELLGSGSLFGNRLLGESFQPWVVMILPAGGFFTLAGWLMVIHAISSRRRAGMSKRGQSLQEAI
ncbi:MAG: electron transport complex subunit RsxE [Pirellulaceae bacterium]|nr:electron transport complex subunit RsxE [Pirellulaceae bacterium]